MHKRIPFFLFALALAIMLPFSTSVQVPAAAEAANEDVTKTSADSGETVAPNETAPSDTTAPSDETMLSDEATLPDGAVLPGMAVHAASNDDDVQVVVSGSMTLTKLSAAYEGGPTTPMPGIAFQVLNADGQVIRVMNTDQDGKALFSDLPAGDYTLREETTPAGYQPLADHPFTITGSHDPDGQNPTYTAVNIKKAGEIRLVKVDAATDETLQGATFTLYDATGEHVVSNASGPLTATTDASGVLVLANVPYGDYLLKETAPAKNYAAAEPIAIHLAASDQQTMVDVVDLGRVGNTLLNGTIWFLKTDGVTPLAGAEFQLSGNGVSPQTATSDTNGTVVFTDVPYSNSPYLISETGTPADHYRKAADIPVTLNEDSADADRTIQLSDVVDTPIGRITLTTLDASSSAGLPGATFDLMDAQENVVQTMTTGQDGSVTFDDVTLNVTGDTSYTLRETTAPADHLSAPDQTVTLTNADGLRTANVTFSNSLKTATVQLLKVDQASTPLQGATFTLYDAQGSAPALVDGHTLTATSGADGMVRLTDVPYGDYLLVETTTPEGYAAVDPITVSLHDGADNLVDGVLMLGTFSDQLLPTPPNVTPDVTPVTPPPTVPPGTSDGAASLTTTMPKMGDPLATTGLIGLGVLAAAAVTAILVTRKEPR